MLIRSLRRLPPSLLLLLVFLSFFGWQLCQGPSHEEPPPPPPPAEPAEKKPLRIALMTFVTEQRSYLYLSLKNKDRKPRPQTAPAPC
jgi:mannan polymerase II complex MNN10 subunit